MISYFLPNKSAANQQNLIDVGLEILLRDGDAGPRFADLAGTGPGDLPGQIVCWSGDGLSYLPDQQEWFEIPADTSRKLPKGRYWIGTRKGVKPSPQELERTTLIAGEVRMILGDGHYWEIPNSLLFPMKFGLGENGEMTKVPREDFRHIFKRTVWAMDLLETSINNNEQIDEEQAVEYCVELLSLNYRINRELALWLGILTPNLLTQFMTFTTDVERITRIYEEVKKKATA